MNSFRDRRLMPLAWAVALLALLPGSLAAQGSIDAPAVAARIGILLDEVRAARQDMAARVDYETSPATMAAGMLRKGAAPDAVENYAKDWGQGYLFSAWADVQPFYDAHADALAESLQRIEAGSVVAAADAEYLERGMEAWREVEFEISSRFDQLVEVLSDRGVHLGRSMELSDRKYAETECCGAKWEEFNAQIAGQQQSADEFSRRSEEQRAALRDFGGRRLFSAIGAETRTVVADEAGSGEAPAETAPMECEEEWYFPEDVDLLDDIQAAYDESESESAAFLEQAERDQAELWTEPAFLRGAPQ
jgi:hypothetical protein